MALALVAVALTLGLGLQAQGRRLRVDLDHQRLLLGYVRATMESLRGGLHPLRTGPVILAAALVAPPAEEPNLRLEVRKTPVDGVCWVQVQGRLLGLKRWHELTLQTEIFAPEAPCE